MGDDYNWDVSFKLINDPNEHNYTVLDNTNLSTQTANINAISDTISNNAESGIVDQLTTVLNTTVQNIMEKNELEHCKDDLKHCEEDDSDWHTCGSGSGFCD